MISFSSIGVLRIRLVDPAIKLQALGKLTDILQHMSYLQPKSDSTIWASATAVVLLHLSIIYALVQGLRHQDWTPALPPIMASIITPQMQTSPTSEPIVIPEPPPKVESVVEVPEPVPKPLIKPVPKKVAPIKAPVKPLVAAERKPMIAPVPVLNPQPVRKAAIVKADACRTPSYPKASLRRNEEGIVKLRFLVDANGKVLQSEVISSSGSTRLDEAAREALALCTFTPATLDGVPTQDWAVLQYEWKIQGRGR